VQQGGAAKSASGFFSPSRVTSSKRSSLEAGPTSAGRSGQQLITAHRQHPARRQFLSQNTRSVIQRPPRLRPAATSPSGRCGSARPWNGEIESDRWAHFAGGLKQLHQPTARVRLLGRCRTSASRAAGRPSPPISTASWLGRRGSSGASSSGWKKQAPAGSRNRSPDRWDCQVSASRSSARGLRSALELPPGVLHLRMSDPLPARPWPAPPSAHAPFLMSPVSTPLGG